MEEKLPIKKIGDKRYVKIVTCRNCKRDVLPKIKSNKAVYPERCPGCNNQYYNRPYKRSDKVKKLK